MQPLTKHGARVDARGQGEVNRPPVDERRALASVGVQFWMNGVIIASFIPRLPEIRTRLGIEVDQLGLLLTFGVVGGLAASAVCGSLIDRFGTKTIMTVASLGVVGTIPLLGFATSVVSFVMVLIALQFLDVLIDVPMNLQGSWLSARRRVPVMNRLHGLWSVGNVSGGLLATVAASRVDLEVHLLAVGGLLLLAMTYVVPGLLRDDQRYRPPGSADRVSPSADGQEPQPTTRNLMTIAMFAALGALAIVAEIVPSDWAAIRLVDDLQVAPGLAGLGFVAFTVGMVVGRLGGDAAAARIGERRLSRSAIAVSTAGLAVASLAPSAPVAVAGFFVAGLGTAVIFPVLYDRAARSSGRPGQVLGAMTAGIRVGLLAIPVSVGTLASGPLTVGQAMVVVGLPAAGLLWCLSWIAERP